MSSPPRHRDLAAEGQGVEDQQDRGRVVVHHRRRLGAGEPGEPPLDMGVSFSAPAGGEVDLEVHGGARRLGHRLDGHFGELGATEVGVEDGAAEVQDRAERRRDRGPCAAECRFGHESFEVLRIRSRVHPWPRFQTRPGCRIGPPSGSPAAASGGRAELVEGASHRLHHGFTPVLEHERLDLGPSQYPIDAGEERQAPAFLSPGMAPPIRPRSSPRRAAAAREPAAPRAVRSRQARAARPVPQARSTAAGNATPVPPSPQYPHGTFARYCWW